MTGKESTKRGQKVALGGAYPGIDTQYGLDKLDESNSTVLLCCQVQEPLPFTRMSSLPP
jgi:hypothetical protein